MTTVGTHGTEWAGERQQAFDFSSFLVTASLLTLVLTGLLDLAAFFFFFLLPPESFSCISISVWSAGCWVRLHVSTTPKAKNHS